ncbi:MAG: thioredoxin domain-containing protein [Bryobacterales bacterium]|nr:thioredoxin domain-containing protein [Bryobacterales bacterium]
MTWRPPVAAALFVCLASATAFAQGLSPLDKPNAEAPKVAPPTNALDKGDLEFYVRHLYVYGPQINVAISDPVESDVPGLLEVTITASRGLQSLERKLLVTKDGKHILEGNSYEIDKNPFRKANETIDTMSAPAFGKEGVSVVLVVYSDFQCPYCAKEAKVLRTNFLHQYGSKARLYFKDFPLSIHNWAKDAAVAGRCIYNQEPEVFWGYHDWIFDNQKSITPENLETKVGEFLNGKSVDSLKFSQCFKNKETLPKVEESLAEGQALGVGSTPTVFVNGRRLNGSPEWEQLKAIIDYELDYQEVTHNAGDDCGCAIDLAFPQ